VGPAGLVALCLVSIATPGAQQPVFRGDTDQVRVFATVTDGDGRLVTTLAKDAFEIRDEGRPQPITLFDNTPQPVRLVVMLDVSGSMEGNLPLLREASAQLVARLRRDDRVRLGTFGSEIAIGPAFTRDPVEVLGALPRAIDPDAPTPLWRALDAAMDAFADGGDQRPVVLVLSDGRDSGPVLGVSGKEPAGRWPRLATQAGVIDRARTEGVMVYAVGMGSRGRRQTPGFGPGGLPAALLSDLPDPGLARVAEETGGGYTEIRFGQDLAAAFTRVAEELHSQYLLGFSPPRRDGKVHEIEVRLSQRGLKARARKSYVAPKEK
jgi:VWFA-related protein